MKKALIILSFALFGVILYWLRAEYNIILYKNTSTDTVEDIDFSPLSCLLWAAIGAAFGAMAAFRKRSKDDSNK